MTECWLAWLLKSHTIFSSLSTGDCYPPWLVVTLSFHCFPGTDYCVKNWNPKL